MGRPPGAVLRENEVRDQQIPFLYGMSFPRANAEFLED